MHGIKARNVAQALPHGINTLITFGSREETRAGLCIVAPGPVITITDRPNERVLFSEIRDANPFFHLIEALWMLNGRNDVAPLTRYVRNFGKFAEPGGEMHGAYGHRWRKALGFDQLNHVVDTLRRDKTSRQCVIQMWDAVPSHRVLDDEWDGSGYDWDCGDVVGGDDLRGGWKDRPCNTHLYLRVRKGLTGTEDGGEPDKTPERLEFLDLTVLCRSNDAIMGAHGANAVHFSVLLEYLAARIGVLVGKLYQFSNNYHAYEKDLERLKERQLAREGVSLLDDRYEDGTAVTPLPMFVRPNAIDGDVAAFFGWHDGSMGLNGVSPVYQNPWFRDVAEWMALAHWHHRQGDFSEALRCAALVAAGDWMVAATEWIKRRIK